jgi:hypothetical protein
MAKLEYFTVKKEETAKDVLRKIKFYHPLRSLYAFEEPIKLGGTQKILTLRVRKSPGIIIRVDGPGWIIEQIRDTINRGVQD